MGQPIKDKTAIVTGGGSGINLEFARLLLSQGANVLIADLALRPEAEQLLAANQPRCAFLKTDVTSWPDLSRTFEVAVQTFGSVDIVCPGAGIGEPPFSNFWYPPGQAPSRDDPTAGRYALLDINLTHPIRMTQLAISHFLSVQRPVSPSNPKSIILISSIAGQVHPLPQPIYNATKHGINGFVRSLGGLESELGIRVAAVAPGVVKTPIWLDSKERMAQVDEDQVWVTPQEVAEAMVALVEKDVIVCKGVDGKEGRIEIRGGTILENGAGVVRDVRAFNDPGPSATAGCHVGQFGSAMDEVWTVLGQKGWGVVE